MQDLDPDLIKKIQNYKLESEEELKDRVTSMGINRGVKALASTVYQVLLAIGAIHGLALYSKTLLIIGLAAAAIVLIAGLLNMYQEFKIEKKMKEEFEKFMEQVDKDSDK